MDFELLKMDQWIALNVTKTLRRLSDAEYAAVLSWCEEANEEPHPNLCLTQPYRYEQRLPKYTTDPDVLIGARKPMNAKLETTKRTESARGDSVQRRVMPQRVFCGDFFISRLENGMLWLGNKDGEGMQVNEPKFEKTLRGFFEEYF